MSFWASSYSFQLESLRAAYCLFKVVLCGFVFTTMVRKPARCNPGLVNFSIESFDAIARASAGYERINRGSNFSMNLLTAQEL